MAARVLGLVLALLLIGSPLAASAFDAVSDGDSVEAVEIEDGPVDDDTSADVDVEDPAGPTELDYLISINTYLTYLFCISAVFTFYFGGRLMYRFLNMFF